MTKMRIGPLPVETIARPPGLEAVIDVGGFKINERRLYDAFVLDRISGLGDADVRDSREINPGRDGETAYEMLRGGRTVTLEGNIRAGNLAMLRMMAQLLRKSLSGPNERRVNFRVNGYYDSFILPTASLYTVGSTDGNTLVVKGDGELRLAEVNKPVEMIHDKDAKYLYETQVTIHHRQIGSTSGYAVSAVKLLADGNSLHAETLNPGGGSNYTLRLFQWISSSMTVLKTATVSIANLGNIEGLWTRASFAGDLITIELWTDDPATAMPLVGTNMVRLYADAGSLGAPHAGTYGFGFTTQNGGDAIYEVSVDPLDGLQDVGLEARKPAPIEIVEEQSGPRLIRPAMVTVRAADPHFTSTGLSETFIPFAPESMAELGLLHLCVFDDVSYDAITNSFYAFDAGSGTVSKSGSNYVMSSSAEKVMYMNRMSVTYSGGHITLKFRVSTSVGTTWTAGVIVKRISSGNYLWARLRHDGANVQMDIVKRVSGSDTVLATTGNISNITAGQDNWLRLRLEGNAATAELWRNSQPVPRGSDQSPDNTVSHTLAGGDATTFGQTTYGKMGVLMIPGTGFANWTFGDIDINFVDTVEMGQAQQVYNYGTTNSYPILVLNNRGSHVGINRWKNTEIGLYDSVEPKAWRKFIFTPSAGGVDALRLADTWNRTFKDQFGNSVYSEIDAASEWPFISPPLAGSSYFDLATSDILLKINGASNNSPTEYGLRIMYKSAWE